MALGKRWSLTFKSLNNTTCSVYIYDEGWTGEVTTLIGAADPFYWEEDNSESLLTVLRYRTGYLRIIEPEYNSLIALYPTSSTSRYVEFYYGERLDFTGYLQVQNFQMDWVASPRILEFPVVSPLGLAQLKKFSLYTQPTRITLGACLFNIITALNATANSASRYTKVIFPDVNPELTGDICTMVISGFSDQFSHADSDSPVFAAEYFDYFLEGVCNAYGWILHDTPDALIFTRYDWNGAYAYYELASLAVPTNKQTCDIAGNVAYKILDSYSVHDANATESVVQPLKSLTLNYEGKDVESVEMTFARTYTDSWKAGGIFGHGDNPTYVPAAVWLKPADNEFSGTRLLDTNTFTAGKWWTSSPGCNLTYSGDEEIGYSERILIGWAADWTVNSELFQWKIYQPPVGLCNFKIKTSWGSGTQAQPGHEARSADLTFNIWMKSGDKYYDFAYSSGSFSSDTRVTYSLTVDDKGEAIVSIYAIPVGVLTIGFLVGNVIGPEMVTIDEMSLSRKTFGFAEYTEVQNPTDMITGNDAGNEEGNITLSLNCYRNDTHLIGLTPMSSKFTEYPYLFEAMNRVVCRFAASDYDTLKNYLAKWRFWIKQWRWRIIAVAFDPWDDIYTLTLHRSPSIESRGYLADVNDNVFQSLDEYLFTVLTDEAPEPPTPPTPVIPTPTITPSAGSILPTATITISVTSPATGAEYSFDNETWTPYSAPFTLASDSTVYARATDGDGNYSDVVSNAYTILPYDAQVEYLEGNGNQYIETGITPDAGTGIKVVVMKKTDSDTYICGLRDTTGNTRWCIGNTAYYGYGNYSGQRSVPKNVIVNFFLNYLNSKKFKVEGYGSESNLPTLSFTPMNNIRLFGSAGVSASYSKWTGRIYACEITQGSDVVMNLIPIRKNGVGYMYDTISGTLFGNSGTGAFTYGNDI